MWFLPTGRLWRRWCQRDRSCVHPTTCDPPGSYGQHGNNRLAARRPRPGIPLRQIQAVVELLDEGNTVPFITRYRKDQTGGLDEEQIREIQSRLTKMRLLADRKQTILRSIEAQGQTDREAGQANPDGHDHQAAGRPLSALQAEEADAGHAGPLARPGRTGAGNSGGRAGLRRSGRPGPRLRPIRTPDPHRGRCPVGRRAYPGRAVQRTGRPAAAACAEILQRSAEDRHQPASGGEPHRPPAAVAESPAVQPRA